MEAIPREIRIYETAGGEKPFTEWMDSIEKNATAYAAVLSRIDRVEVGNFGSCRNLGGGIWELKIDVGRGYRVYFGEDGDLVILLLGGTKQTQSADIETARAYWNTYNA